MAPVSTRDGRDFFPSLDLPTMIVYGELDTGLGLSSSKDLQLIPTSTKPQVLPGARHPAYLDQVTPQSGSCPHISVFQPQLWHQLLANFISAL